MMTIDLGAIRVRGAIRSARGLRDPDLLALHVEQWLVAVDWPLLREAAKMGAVVLGPRGEGKVVSDGVGVDNAWTVFPDGERLLLAGEGEISILDVKGAKPKKIAVNGLSSGTFGASLNGDGARVLLVVVRDVNFDFAEYGVAVADLKTGQLVGEHTIAANADLDLSWDGKSRAWLIEDTATGSQWRWNGETPAVGLEGRTAAPIERLVLLAKPHPTSAIWACLSSGTTGQNVEIRDTGGKVLASASLPRGMVLRELMWSGSDPNRFWGVGIRALASATVVPG